MHDILREMEHRYRCRYENGGPGLGLQAFPVTHVLEGHAEANSARAMRYACVRICNGELLNWSILSADGGRVIHGAERNLSGTRAGYIAMIHRVLQRLQSYGARRVYPRDPAHRMGAARASAQWCPQGWPRGGKNRYTFARGSFPLHRDECLHAGRLRRFGPRLSPPRAPLPRTNQCVVTAPGWLPESTSCRSELIEIDGPSQQHDVLSRALSALSIRRGLG